MKKIIPFLLAAIFVATTVKASEKKDSTKIYFENAFTELKSMIEGKTPANFERAVFTSENAYWNNKYSFENFINAIDIHLYSIEKLIAANDKSDTMNFSASVMSNGKFKMDDIRYLPKEKKELYLNALKNWAIFKYMVDTTSVAPFYHLPFSYASNDPFGRKEWGNSQVLNLLASGKQKGNCFALTGLFKIFSDRLNAGATICTAPQHIFIQHKDHKGDLYNVELATAGHPGDGMIQTLTYTTNEAIMSGIALREYNDKESIGLCLVNLAKSYEHKFNSKGDGFILKCAELALKHDTLNLNALLLKQQVLDERVISYALKNKINDLNRLKTDKGISGTFFRLQKHLLKLNELGYKQMPLYMQQMILNGFSDEQTGSIYAAKNPSPFTTVKPKDKKDEQYWTLSHGAFQEVFVHKKFETYGHFTLNTEAKIISAIDTTEQKGFLIDPVAFAYDFGARMYDARLGIFISIDPLASKYPSWSPYVAFADNPIRYTDVNGMGPKDRVQAARNQTGLVYKQETAPRSLRTANTVEALTNMDCSEFVCRVLKADDITSKVEDMTSSGLQVYLSNTDKFEKSQKAQAGDVAVWKGHVGIVGEVDDKGNIKLIHAAKPGVKSYENPTFTTKEVMGGKDFVGYFRPKEETKEGKITPESGVGNVQVGTKTDVPATTDIAPIQKKEGE